MRKLSILFLIVTGFLCMPTTNAQTAVAQSDSVKMELGRFNGPYFSYFDFDVKKRWGWNDNSHCHGAVQYRRDGKLSFELPKPIISDINAKIKTFAIISNGGAQVVVKEDSILAFYNLDSVEVEALREQSSYSGVMKLHYAETMIMFQYRATDTTMYSVGGALYYQSGWQQWIPTRKKPLRPTTTDSTLWGAQSHSSKEIVAPESLDVRIAKALGSALMEGKRLWEYDIIKLNDPLTLSKFDKEFQEKLDSHGLTLTYKAFRKVKRGWTHYYVFSNAQTTGKSPTTSATKYIIFGRKWQTQDYTPLDSKGIEW